MPPKVTKPKIPDIHWADDNDGLYGNLSQNVKRKLIIRFSLGKRRQQRYIKLPYLLDDC